MRVQIEPFNATRHGRVFHHGARVDTPVTGFAEFALRRVAAAGGTTAACWAAILTIGPVLGSFITEPAAMTNCALLLARQFFDLQPSTRLKYATLGYCSSTARLGGR